MPKTRMLVADVCEHQPYIDGATDLPYRNRRCPACGYECKVHEATAADAAELLGLREQLVLSAGEIERAIRFDRDRHPRWTHGDADAWANAARMVGEGEAPQVVLLGAMRDVEANIRSRVEALRRTGGHPCDDQAASLEEAADDLADALRALAGEGD